ncbi:MAG: iron chaperone [Gaiellaceae bacterium]
MTEAKKTEANKTAANKTPAKKTATKKAAAKKTPAKKALSASGFSDVERAAMKERAEELKAAGRGGRKKSEDANAVLAKIAEMPQPDRSLAERIHAIITSVAPELSPKTWYGMPAYAKDGKILCFFQSAQKFEARYASFGFNDTANLDDGTMWPTAYAVTDLSDANVKRIEELVKRAVS